MSDDIKKMVDDAVQEITMHETKLTNPSEGSMYIDKQGHVYCYTSHGWVLVDIIEQPWYVDTPLWKAVNGDNDD